MGLQSRKAFLEREVPQCEQGSFEIWVFSEGSSDLDQVQPLSILEIRVLFECEQVLLRDLVIAVDVQTTLKLLLLAHRN